MKRIPSRHLLNHWKPTIEALKPGESIAVTKRQEVLGTFTRSPQRQVKRPNFRQLLEAEPYSPAQGEALLALMDRADESLS